MKSSNKGFSDFLYDSLNSIANCPSGKLCTQRLQSNPNRVGKVLYLAMFSFLSISVVPKLHAQPIPFDYGGNQPKSHIYGSYPGHRGAFFLILDSSPVIFKLCSFLHVSMGFMEGLEFLSNGNIKMDEKWVGNVHLLLEEMSLKGCATFVQVDMRRIEKGKKTFAHLLDKLPLRGVF